jgi:hypothetical protein
MSGLAGGVMTVDGAVETVVDDALVDKAVGTALVEKGGLGEHIKWCAHFEAAGILGVLQFRNKLSAEVVACTSATLTKKLMSKASNDITGELLKNLADAARTSITITHCEEYKADLVTIIDRYRVGERSSWSRSSTGCADGETQCVG